MSTKSFAGWLICCCALFLGERSSADAVAWYRFEDGEPLARLQAGASVTNSAGSEFTAALRTISSTTLDGSIGDAYWPTFTNSAPPALYNLYDPVSGQILPNGGGLHFHTANMNDTKGCVLYAGDSERLRALTNLTLEAFVRLPPEVPIGGSYMRPIILKQNEAYQGTWGLHIFESNLFFRCTFVRASGTRVGIGWGNGSKSVRVDDGRWHHVALTVDFGAQQARAYVDYEQINRSALNSGDDRAVSFYHPATSPLVIGGNTQHNTRRFNGEMDEVRISDEALPPERFLRWIPARETDAETPVRLSLDEGYVPDWFSTTKLPLNAATNGALAVTTSRQANVIDPVPSDETPATVVRSCPFDVVGGDNLGSVYTITNGARNGTILKVDDSANPISTGSFTVETFFRTRGQTSKNTDDSDQYRYSFCLFNSNYMKVLINGANGGRVLFRAVGGNEAYSPVPPRCDDGQWHHLAYVYDKDQGKVFGYIDYVRVASFSTAMGQSSAGLFIGGQGSNYQVFNGWLDEVRVTRRALVPREFLVQAAQPLTALGEATFEGKYDIQQGDYTNISRTASVAARATGMEPMFATSTPGDIIWDGLDGTDVRPNTRSVRLDGGRIDWPHSPLLDTDDVTYELFAKLDKCGENANLLRLNNSLQNDGAMTCALYFPDRLDSATRCILRMDTVTNGATATVLHSVALPKDVYDHAWHHWAITFSRTPETNTQVGVWFDYASVTNIVQAGALRFTGGESLAIGASSFNGADLHGNVDNLRVSAGVLPPASFLRTRSRGTLILIR